ncbi:IclR family transcriptional regulator [Termitidicoccus mucosus]|uniref:IclR family transcriptional regulator n=1 Tax=Termitidicoccus mucosus TaxID=1184151 RepID=UPI000A04D471
MAIAVLDKAFSILEVLARAGRSLSLAELAEESRQPKPSAFRILRSLRDLGYVEQEEERGSYRLSERLNSLREYGRDEYLRNKALPLMQSLHAEFDETVNLGVLEGIYIRYAHVLETTQPLRWIVKPGARDAFHTTALGRAVVANLHEVQRERLIAKIGATLPSSKRRTAMAALKSELDATRERGWATEEEETVPGVACIAVPLASMGEPLVAVSVSVPVHRFPPERREEIKQAMLEAAGASAAGSGPGRKKAARKPQ